MTGETFTATCLVWDEETGKVDKLATYEARTRLEAINWLKMMKDWSKDPRINGERVAI